MHWWHVVFLQTFLKSSCLLGTVVKQRERALLVSSFMCADLFEATIAVFKWFFVDTNRRDLYFCHRYQSLFTCIMHHVTSSCIMGFLEVNRTEHRRLEFWRTGLQPLFETAMNHCLFVKVEAPIRKSDLIWQYIKAPTVATMHTQKWAAWILFTLE
jgi:hypothetical protein